ncbi:MAG: hypothetical protein ACKVJX_15175 [Verrucomicrobiia bacterium]
MIIEVMVNSSNPSQNKQPNPQEQELIEGFRRHPELRERIQAIMKLADSGEGAADEVDALLVEEIRRLGKTTMESWYCVYSLSLNGSGARPSPAMKRPWPNASAVVQEALQESYAES